MEAITHRLQQLYELEDAMQATRAAVLFCRKNEDLELHQKRIKEDEAWSKRLDDRDREEDVSTTSM